MSLRKRIATILAYFALMSVVLLALLLPSDGPIVSVNNAEELAGVDFERSIASLRPSCFEWYPNRLYTPADFARGITGTPETGDRGSFFGTNRLVLSLEPGKVYGVSAYSATYAQTLWVNGVVLSSMGTPGDSLETMSPKTGYYTVYFTAAGETEIVIQHSSFVHVEGGRLFPLHVGEQSLISAMVSRIHMRGFVIMGSMLMASLFLLGVYLVFTERRQFLWFSLACILMAIRTLSIDHKLIMVILPSMSWEIAHRLEYIATINFFTFFFLHINRTFNQKKNRPLDTFGIFIACADSVVVLATSSSFYTKLLPYMHVTALAYMLPAVFLLALNLIRNPGPHMMESILLLCGVAGYTVLAVMDLASYYFFDFAHSINLMQAGVILFVFANTLAMALGFTRTEVALAEARQRERNMEETNKLLERLDKLKSDFLSNISHELRTPLTVMSGYAQLTGWEIDTGCVNDMTLQNLAAISREAKRLAQLASRLLSVSVEGALWDQSSVSLPDVLGQAVFMCRPILAKNNNRMSSRAQEGLPSVSANQGMILQVLTNLIVNANKHTHGGEIRLLAYATMKNGRPAGSVTVAVDDNGEGVDPMLLPLVFERNVSGHGGTGLGLTICKDVVEAHGGRIAIRNKSGGGARVTFTLPIEKEGRPHEADDIAD